MITDNAVNPIAKLRLVILYALRYQKTQASNIASLINLALQNGVPTEAARVSFVFPLGFDVSLNEVVHSLCTLYST